MRKKPIRSAELDAELIFFHYQAYIDTSKKFDEKNKSERKRSDLLV